MICSTEDLDCIVTVTCRSTTIALAVLDLARGQVIELKIKLNLVLSSKWTSSLPNTQCTEAGLRRREILAVQAIRNLS